MGQDALNQKQRQATKGGWHGHGFPYPYQRNCESMIHASPILPDLLAPDLRVVFCGTAPGPASARREAYYAGPGNRFWPTLHRTGLVPERLRPEDYPRLLEWGIGLTDLVKTRSGMDHDLVPADYDAVGLVERLWLVRPRIVAFNSKQAARMGLGLRVVPYGLLEGVRLAGAEVHVLPSTSGRAAGFWDEEPWFALALAAA